MDDNPSSSTTAQEEDQQLPIHTVSPPISEQVEETDQSSLISNDDNNNTPPIIVQQQTGSHSSSSVKIVIRGYKEEEETSIIPSSEFLIQEDSNNTKVHNFNDGDISQPLISSNIQQPEVVVTQPSFNNQKETTFHKILTNLHFIFFGNRWISFLFGALLTFLSGTHYAYSSISPTIKNDLNFSQTQVNLIGTAANVGTYFALPVSMLNDFVGSRITCTISGVLLFCGYFMFYLVYIKAIDMVGTDAYVFIACFMAVMGQGSAGAYAAAITTNIKNFEPKHRGKIIGFMGSCVALSSAVFSFVYSVGFERKLGDYLLFVGTFGGVTVVVGTLFMNQIGLKAEKENSSSSPSSTGGSGNGQDETRQRNSKGGYSELNQNEDLEDGDVNSFVHDEDLEDDVEQFNDFLMINQGANTQQQSSQQPQGGNTLEQDNKVENPIETNESSSEVGQVEEDLEGFDLSKQLILEERGEAMQEQVDQIEEIENSRTPKTASDREIANKYEKIWKIAKTPIPDANPLQMLFTLDFYLVFYVYFATIGSGLVIVNNLGSIVISFGGYDGQQHLMVMIFACSNALGRLVFGLISDSLSRYITRTTFLTGGVLLMVICQLIVLVSPLWVYYFILVLLGISFGGVAVMVPSFLSERFGPKYFAVNSSICSLASSLGSFLLATLLAGKVYENNIPIDNMSKICYGTMCFQTTFYLTTTLCCLAAVGGIILMYRTRGLYQILYYRKVLNMNTNDLVTK